MISSLSVSVVPASGCLLPH